MEPLRSSPSIRSTTLRDSCLPSPVHRTLQPTLHSHPKRVGLSRRTGHTRYPSKRLLFGQKQIVYSMFFLFFCAYFCCKRIYGLLWTACVVLPPCVVTIRRIPARSVNDKQILICLWSTVQGRDGGCVSHGFCVSLCCLLNARLAFLSLTHTPAHTHTGAYTSDTCSLMSDLL